MFGFIFNFLFPSFRHHHCTIMNKFMPGDVCLWPHEIDGCMDSVVEIIDYYKVYDKKKKIEYIVYTFEDIYRGQIYDWVEEKYLTLLASYDEMVDSISPYEYFIYNSSNK